MGLSPQRVTVSATASQLQLLVSGVTARQIHVHGFSLSADTVASIAALSDTGGAVLSGNIRFQSGGTVLQPPSFPSLYATTPGTGLNLQATTGTISGVLWYSMGA